MRSLSLKIYYKILIIKTLSFENFWLAKTALVSILVNIIKSVAKSLGCMYIYAWLYVTYVAPMTGEDTKAALRIFDEHFHLMTLIEPCCIQESLQSSGLIPNGDLFTGTPSLAGSTLMDNVLKEVRSCIECNGAEKFLMFINVVQTESRYMIFGLHLSCK